MGMSSALGMPKSLAMVSGSCKRSDKLFQISSSWLKDPSPEWQHSLLHNLHMAQVRSWETHLLFADFKNFPEEGKTAGKMMHKRFIPVCKAFERCLPTLQPWGHCCYVGALDTADVCSLPG